MGHTFTPMQYDRNHCKVCYMLPGHPNHLMELPGMETVHEEREAVNATEESERLSAIMRTAKRDISSDARLMEAESPLFGYKTLF